ncbi:MULTISPECIES: PRC-barrel domain-containing protein [Halomonadaceae]|uniref:PRC-barrel domain-containing protein n=1 Tax=Halomonadaceae TaxID=28256 RepID=UPI00159A97C8|nr:MULTISPECIES: PRC-barrel domain-containing protein [Halomonas]QJQ96545.1 PRC-barrel domain-containing protein [Halomonas sp. PA5]
MKRTALAIAIGAICAGLSTGVLAQEASDDADLNDNGMTQEQNDAPTVTDDQPDDTGMEADQPDDTGMGATQPGADDTDEGITQDNNQQTQVGGDDDLMSKQVSDLEGMTVVNQDGEDIGNIQHIAQHNETGDLYAVVSVGGLWGIGATDIALSIDEMEVQDDQLVMSTTYGEDEIESSSDEYNEENYTELDGDMTLSEAHQQ